VAATHVAKQVLWQRSLFTELDFDIPITSTIFTDNQAAILISHHPEFHSRTKHIDIAHHFLRDLITDGTLNTIYVNMRENLADLFMKGLPRELHEDLTYRLGVLILAGSWARKRSGHSDVATIRCPSKVFFLLYYFLLLYEILIICHSYYCH